MYRTGSTKRNDLLEQTRRLVTEDRHRDTVGTLARLYLKKFTLCSLLALVSRHS